MYCKEGVFETVLVSSVYYIDRHSINTQKESQLLRLIETRYQVQPSDKELHTEHTPHTYLLTYVLTYLTPWCRVLLEKLTGLQLVKKFPAFHGTRRFITALTSVRHLSLSSASPIQSIYLYPTPWRSILILSTHLRLDLPTTKNHNFTLTLPLPSLQNETTNVVINIIVASS